jgi:hypothetical protein
LSLRIARLFALGVVLLGAAAGVAAGELRTIDFRGKPVEVYIPTPLPLRLSPDGRLAEDGRLPRILIADPDPAVAPIHIPRRVPWADIAVGDPTASFLIDYVAAGGTDAFGEPCFAFPAQAQVVVNAAVAIWAEEIVSTVPIRIRACWASLGGSTLGYSGGGTLHRDFAGAPVAGTWYGAALANSLAGVDLNASAVDMHITYSAGFSWYFGTDGATPAGLMDLMSVVLHEVGHGLDFAGTASVSGGLGRWGLGTGFPSIYDRFVHDGGATPLLNTAVYPNNSATLASLLTSQDLWFRGTHAMAANGGAPVKLFAPTTWLSGSSYSHLDYATFVGTPNRLMVYALSAGVAVHDPGPVALGLLRDLGWSPNPGTPTYTLNVASIGASAVAITATPSAYAGTTNYSRTGIASGTSIALSAPPQSGGSGFTGWAGCDSTSATTCTLVMNAARSVTAGYASYVVNVSATPSAGGSASCSPNPVPHGGSSTCTASASTGYTFTAFSGDCTGATCALSNVTGSRSVTAHFLGSQTVSFAPLPDMTYGDPPITLSASASSGLTVAFDGQSPTVCSVAGTQLTILSAGTCVVRATQAGNATYLPAPPVTRSFNVGRAASWTSITSTPTTVPASASVVLTATVNGVAPTGTVSFRLHNAPLAGCGAVALTGTGGTRTAQCTSLPLAQGTYGFIASYAGDGNHGGSSAATHVNVTPVPGLACAAFTDVDAASSFCPDVDWLRNRAITLGCTATTYCPTDSVSRLAMAAFMNRLGTALTGLPVQVVADSGALDLDAAPVVCATGPITASGFARAALIDGVLSAQGAGAADVLVEVVSSANGTQWTSVSTAMRASLAAGRMVNTRVMGSYDFVVGESMRFGLRVSRGGGAANVSASQCRLRIIVGNRSATYSPFDAERP